MVDKLTHLKQLEAESIHIIREVAAEFGNPVMPYSIGKDSAVMLHLARTAFFPGKLPFPVLHVDTRWKFQEMYAFRSRRVEEMGLELITHINPEGVAQDMNPFTYGSAKHTDVMKTQGLKQAVDLHGFDVAFGGARRDEEKSRAKERVFSFRTSSHRWDPKNQRPELWNLYNGYKSPGESIRVFPLSNWTELDIWEYIYREHIPIVPLYFAQDGKRYRSLGDQDITHPIDSNAATLEEIIKELETTNTSERAGRAMDHEREDAFERLRASGYM